MRIRVASRGRAIAIGAAAALVGGAGCTVDRRPSPDACEPAIGCRTGYVCDPATHRCLEQLYLVTVSIDGSGSGTVTSTPPGIDCSATSTPCSASFQGGSSVTLTAMPDPGSTFWRFQGDCTGSTCDLIMNSVKTVSATFLGGAVLWARRFGGTGADTGYGVAVDRASGVAVAGSFESVADFGGASSLTSAGAEDLFLADFARVDGAYGWAVRYGGRDTDVAQSIAVDPTSGEISMAGYFRTGGTPSNFGGADVLSTGLLDIVAGRYRIADGSWIWDREMGSPMTDAGSAVAVDPRTGDVVVTGYGIHVDYGDGVQRGDPASYDAFVAKYAAANGAFLWAVTFGGVGMYVDDHGYGVAVDANGDVLVAGTFAGTTDFGDAAPVTSLGSGDIYAVKLAGADGRLVWKQTFGTASPDGASAIAVDSNGNAIIVGNYGGTLTMGSFRLTNVGFSDVFVAKLVSTDGTVVWAQRLGGMDDDYGYGVAVGPTGDAVVTGLFHDSIDLGSTLPTLQVMDTTGNPDVFVAKLSGFDGHGLWLERFGGSGTDVGHAVAVDPATGDAFVVGTFEQMADFGGSMLSAALNDGFVVALAP